VSIVGLEDEALVLPRDTPSGPFRSLVEHLCAHAGFAPRVVYEVDALPAALALVAAVISVVLRHGLTVASVPSAATVLPLEGPCLPATERRSRTGHANSARDALHIVCARRSSVRLTGASRPQLSQSRIRVAETRWAACVGAVCAGARGPLCGM
jgi:LysR substrate binding domain-containing protein